MTRIYLGVGTNTDREHYLHRGLDALEQLLGPLELSPVFESDAVGILGTRFYNMVVGAECSLSLPDLNSALKAIEAACGRREQSSPSRITLDVDILEYGDLTGRYGKVILPRPEVRTNAFVLWPLALLAPQVTLPGSDLTHGDLWSRWQGDQRLWPTGFSWRDRQLTPLELLTQKPHQTAVTAGSGAA